MDNFFDGPWIWAVFITIAVVTIVGRLIYERWRTTALEAVASRLDLSFEAKATLDGDIAVLGFPLFSRGGSSVRNLMFGHIDAVTLQIFGYVYSTGSGKNRTTYRQTVAVFTSETLQLPSFELSPEHFLHRIGGAFGYQDIDFDTHPKFSKDYLLRGEDEAAVRERFDADLLAFFESGAKLHVEGRPGGLLVYRSKRRESPGNIEAFAEQAIDVFSQFVRPA